MATAKKAAPAKAAPAAKATPSKAKAAPAPAPVEDETNGIVEGSQVRFLGYDEDTPDSERVLTEGEVYTVAGFSEVEEGEEPGILVEIDNPDFNAKKKESDDNPRTISVEVFPEEVELVHADEKGEETAEEAAPAPAPAPAKGKAAAKAAPAKGKAAEKAAPAPAKGKAAAKAAPQEEPGEQAQDELPDLEGEDESVLALIAEGDLIEIAQDLEAEAASKEWQLGGVLFHIKKDKAYLELEGGEEYAEKGGFEKFLQEYFNIEYRKAMYLIDIYVKFTLAGIENPADRLASIGWTKASKITNLLVAENANVDEVLELAENNTVSDLVETIKEQARVGGAPGSGGVKKTRITVKLRYFEAEAALVEETLAAAAQAYGVKDNADALLKILEDWQQEHAGTEKATASTGKATAKAAPAQKTGAAKRATAKA